VLAHDPYLRGLLSPYLPGTELLFVSVSLVILAIFVLLSKRSTVNDRTIEGKRATITYMCPGTWRLQHHALSSKLSDHFLLTWPVFRDLHGSRGSLPLLLLNVSFHGHYERSIPITNPLRDNYIPSHPPHPPHLTNKPNHE